MFNASKFVLAQSAPDGPVVRALDVSFLARLQETVEGLSVVAISYYAVSLGIGAALVIMGLSLDGVGVPVREAVFTAVATITGTGYSVTFTLDGFNTVVREDVVIQAQRTTAFDITMSLATVEEMKHHDPIPLEELVDKRERKMLFQELARRSEAPRWNFNKYLIGADGTVVAHFGSNVSPDSEQLQNAIEKLL